MGTRNLEQLFSFHEEDRQAITKLIDAKAIRKTLDLFYDQFSKHDAIKGFFTGKALESLKDAQFEHWSVLLEHGANEDYLQKAKVIGEVHDRVGIEPDFYLTGYSMILTELLCHAFPKRKDREKIAPMVKMVMLDMAASLVAYVDKVHEDGVHEASQGVVMNVMDDTVDVSMLMNHIFIDSIKASRASIEVDRQMNSIASAIEEMTASISTIAQNSSQANSKAEEAAISTKSGQQVSAEAMKNMNLIQEAVEGTSDKAESLAESSKKIEEIVTKIEKIADQTNLLALNATIEAARAGEAGKGFAVVANEVKTLSNETSKATEEISSIIGELVKNIQNIVDSMQDMTSTVQSGRETTENVKMSMEEIERQASEISTLMHEVSSVLSEQGQSSDEISRSASVISKTSSDNKDISTHNAELCEQMGVRLIALTENITSMADHDDAVIIKLAKSDHIIWKRKLFEMLIGKIPSDPEALKTHTSCRLGKWYYAEGGERFGQEDFFKKLEAPHIRMHELGLQALEALKTKPLEEALSYLEEIEDASQEIIDLLSELDKACQLHAAEKKNGKASQNPSQSEEETAIAAE